jgi:hypothetical protein
VANVIRIPTPGFPPSGEFTYDDKNAVPLPSEKLSGGTSISFRKLFAGSPVLTIVIPPASRRGVDRNSRSEAKPERFSPNRGPPAEAAQAALFTNRLTCAEHTAHVPHTANNARLLRIRPLPSRLSDYGVSHTKEIDPSPGP